MPGALFVSCVKPLTVGYEGRDEFYWLRKERGFWLRKAQSVDERGRTRLREGLRGWLMRGETKKVYGKVKKCLFFA